MDTSHAPTANTVYVTDGSTEVFITVGKSSSPDASTDLQSDLKAAGATFDPSQIATTSPSGNVFDKEAYVSYQATGGTNKGYELVDSNSSDDFSAFVDIHAPSELEAVNALKLVNLVAQHTSISGSGSS